MVVGEAEAEAGERARQAMSQEQEGGRRGRGGRSGWGEASMALRIMRWKSCGSAQSSGEAVSLLPCSCSRWDASVEATEGERATDKRRRVRRRKAMRRRAPAEEERRRRAPAAADSDPSENGDGDEWTRGRLVGPESGCQAVAALRVEEDNEWVYCTRISDDKAHTR